MSEDENKETSSIAEVESVSPDDLQDKEYPLPDPGDMINDNDHFQTASYGRNDVREMRITPVDVFETPDWRAHMQGQRQAQFNDRRKAIYLHALSMFGRKSHAARAAGVSMSTIQNHRNADVDFSEAEEFALEHYLDHLREAVYEQGVVGIMQPMIDKNGSIAAYRREMSPQLLLAEIKKFDPDYRDNRKIDLNVNGQMQHGVLRMPSAPSVEDWEKKAESLTDAQNAAMQKLVEEATADNPMIDVTPRVVEEDD